MDTSTHYVIAIFKVKVKNKFLHCSNDLISKEKNSTTKTALILYPFVYLNAFLKYSFLFPERNCNWK